MRLDHLLSKEHCRSSDLTEPDPRHMFSAGAHGWNIDIGLEQNLEIPVRRLADRNESTGDARGMHAVGS